MTVRAGRRSWELRGSGVCLGLVKALVVGVGWIWDAKEGRGGKKLEPREVDCKDG